MRAASIQRIGPAEGVEIIDLPGPVPGTGEVLITVEAIGVGGVDALLRRGAIPGVTMPGGYVPGGEIAGVVTACGAGVDRSWLERQVWASTGVTGAYAEQAVADVGTLVELPAGLSPTAAVTLGSAGAVAHFGLERARLAAGERVLVRGASGSIGIAAVQLAADAGAGVIAVTTSSAERGQRLRRLGATHLLDRSMTPLPGERTAAPSTYDVILDVVAGPHLASAVGLLTPNGRLVLVGAVGGPAGDGLGSAVMEAFQRSITVSTLSLDTIAPDELSRVRRDQFDAARQGRLEAVVHEVLPLEQAAGAHARMDAGDVFGRIVLEVG